MPDPRNACEQRVRRAAKREGYVLRKDQARQWSLNHNGGYKIVDADLNAVIAGSPFDVDRDDVEEWLKS
jgi:hypothetical protein